VKNFLLKETQSKRLFQRAETLLVGGVNSPVRSFRSVGRKNPVFISRAKGSKIWDVDGNEYVDYVCSWGASILGSAHPYVVKAVKSAASRGLSFGAATEREVRLAERVKVSFPSFELARFVSSGTEATMSAVRVARAFTGRDKIIKFDGCYHGHSDSFLVDAGSGLATFHVERSAGITSRVAENTLVARFNDLASAEKCFEENRNSVACVIVEPVAGNMGVIPPAKGFLEGLRNLCDQNDSLLVFDEIITGFRVSKGGAQKIYGVKPDLTCLGKVIGGGMNIAAYGGREEVMKLVSPLGPVYQAGTLSGNPIAVSAGLATLDLLTDRTYSKLEKISSMLEKGLAGAGVRIQRVGSMIGLFFVKDVANDLTSYDDVKNLCDKEKYSRFFSSMLEHGVYFPPSAFETIFVSSAHSLANVRETVEKAAKIFQKLK
jgi:glutamate-1-semialdehyde 2,1-aminomutase